MILGLCAGLLSAGCYGLAAVLQALAARTTAAGDGVDPRLLLRLMRRTPFVAGLLLDCVGFAAQFVALRHAPVFLVQAAMAASLAVTAVVATKVLATRLRRIEWAAVAVVVAGLALLALSAGAEGTTGIGDGVRYALLGCVAVLAAAGFAAGRLPGPGHAPADPADPANQAIPANGPGHDRSHDRAGPARGWVRAAVLGGVAGLGFGVVAIAARALVSLSPGDLVRDPAAYALAAGGAVAFLFYASSLQLGSVTTATAAIVVGETVVPALVGVALLGDGTRPGFVPVAATGFVLALAGALTLARFGEPTTAPAS